jgi:hypothetical protein
MHSDALQEKLRERAAGNGPPVLLDVRNAYEWEVGRFQVCDACAGCAYQRATSLAHELGYARCVEQGADRPVTECFRETVEANTAPGGCANARGSAGQP